MNLRYIYRVSGGIACLILLGNLLGCGRSDVCQVYGQVTFDGKPIASGEIRMLPADGKGPSAGCLIHDGEYELSVRPGPKTVEIYEYAATGRVVARDSTMSGPTREETRQSLPPEYNAASTLKLEVVASAEHNFRLPLQN